MQKPDKPHNFEPEIYMMERTARDKLIADYNSMDIWDFNEKYGELWDFTVNTREDIIKSTWSSCVAGTCLSMQSKSIIA